MSAAELYERLAETFRAGLERLLRSRFGAQWQDAEDAVDELLFTIFQRALAGRMPLPDSWDRYLRGGAIREFRSQLVRRSRDRSLTAPPRTAETPSEETAGPAPTLDRAIRDARLSPAEGRALALLSAGSDYAEAARLLGTTPGSLYVLVFRARRKLADAGLRRRAV